MNLKKIKNKFKRNMSLKYRGKKHVPLPTGPFKVIAFRDIMTGTKGIESGVLARFYYPSIDQNIEITDQYTLWPNWFPHQMYRYGYADVASLKRESGFRLVNWIEGSTFIPAIINAKPYKEIDTNNEVESIKKMPVIIFSHGIGGCRTVNSSLCLELASHGFFVAAIEHRDESACATFYPNEIEIPFHRSNPDISLPTVDVTVYENQVNTVSERQHFIETITEENEIENDCLICTSPSNQMNQLNQLDEIKQTNNPITFIPKTKTEWIRYRHITSETDQYYELRNEQVKQRSREIVKLLELMDNLNQGENVCNILDGLFDSREFKGLFNMEKVTLMGHSMGAAASIVVASQETSKVFSIVALDAWLFPIQRELKEIIFPQPVLFINSEKFANANKKQNLTVINLLRKYQDVIPTENFDIWNIKGTAHYNQTDLPFVYNHLVKVLFGGSSNCNPLTAHDLTSSLILNFLCNKLQLIQNYLLPQRQDHLDKNIRKLKSGFMNPKIKMTMR